MSTEDTLGHHLQAFSEGVDAIMEDYTPDSVLFTPDGLLKGLDSIRAFFHAFLTNSPPRAAPRAEDGPPGRPWRSRVHRVECGALHPVRLGHLRRARRKDPRADLRDVRAFALTA